MEQELSINLSEANRPVPAAASVDDSTPTIDAEKLINFSTTTTSFPLLTPLSSDVKLLDDFLLDCELADSPLLPRTYWISPFEDVPSSSLLSLESLALSVFRHHTSSLPPGSFDAATSGAEWWIQVRPSPPNRGRYAVAGAALGLSASGITFHYDKDEEIFDATGIALHPWVSTVTYLTDKGPPTLVYEHRLSGAGGMEGSAMGRVDKLGVIWPSFGKHMSFDGRFLHGGVGDLCPASDNWPPKKIPTENEDGADAVKVFRRQEMRITFLVNVWLNHKPWAIDRFPEFMRGHLTKHDVMFGDASTSDDSGIRSSSNSSTETPKSELPVLNVTDSVATTRFRWPLGCDKDTEDSSNTKGESWIVVDLPLEEVQKKADTILNFVSTSKKNDLVDGDDDVAGASDGDGGKGESAESDETQPKKQKIAK